MAVVAGSSDESEDDTQSTGDSTEWGIVATPNLNSGSLIGQSTVHQSTLLITEVEPVNYYTLN